ncbi:MULTISPECIES: hypothetical protein [unclassified Microcoleus]|uniref:hypothetical protein n=1 Tax=unclassified Microcoleus TaxID=2642155 RepID=UPI002FD7360C
MSQKARSPFWLRMFLQGRAIALHVYQMPNLRSPFWNKSKSAIAFWLFLAIWQGRSVLSMDRGDRYEWDGKVDRFSRPRNLAFWFEEGRSFF